jgi:hypothetical protein
METQTSSAEALKPPSAESLEERLKKTEDELHKKCAEIVVLQQALHNLEKRVLDLETRAPHEVFILFITLFSSLFLLSLDNYSLKMLRCALFSM